MKQKLFEIYDSVIEWLKLWPELWAIPVVLTKFFLTAALLQWFDPTAATFDIGILQTIMLAIVAVTCFNGIAFIVIRLNFPSLYKFYKELFHDHTVLSPWQKTMVLTALYLGLLGACCLLAAAFA